MCLCFRMHQSTINTQLLSSSELDRYFPDRKVGLWIGSWNMAEIKVGFGLWFYIFVAFTNLMSTCSKSMYIIVGTVNMASGCKRYIRLLEQINGCDSYFEVKCSNFESRYKWNNYLALNNMSVKLLVIVIIDFKLYPSTYCLGQDRCFICSYF